MKTTKHKNVGLLFEFLTHQFLEETSKKNSAKVQKALYIIKKYFRKGTQLNEELKLFNTILYNQVSKYPTASRLLAEVLKASKNIDDSKLRNEKYNLLKEIYANFEKKEFFDAWIPNYKVYSSIYALMEDARGTDLKLEIDTKVMLEEQVLSHLMENKEIKRMNEFVEKLSTNETEVDNMDDLTFHFVIKKFNEKYNSILSPGQREILREYISCTSDREFNEFVERTSNSIDQQLYDGIKQSTDRSISSKLFEAMKRLSGIKEIKDRDKTTEALMTYSQLASELNKLKQGK